MQFQGLFKDKSYFSKIGILLLLVFISVIFHIAIFIVLTMIFSDGNLSVIQNQDLTNQISVNYLKLVQLLTGLGLFIVPILLHAYLVDYKFKFNSVSRQSILLVITIIMLITPFISLLLEWNMQIPFPEWVLAFENNSEVIIEAFLKMDGFWDLLYTLLVMAIVPAIWEELIFRGYLQQTAYNWLRNPHVAILIIAFLFSAIHFHIEAIIPRFFLGVLLGYLYYWSKSLWLPILAHFVNNAQAVIFAYPLFKVDGGIYSLVSKNKVDPMLALFSFFSVLLLLYLLQKNLNTKKD